MFVDGSFRDGIGVMAYAGALLGTRARAYRCAKSDDAEIAAVLFAAGAARAAGVRQLTLASDHAVAALAVRPRQLRDHVGLRQIAEVMEEESGWLLCHVRSDLVKDAHSVAKRTLRRVHCALREAETAVVAETSRPARCG